MVEYRVRAGIATPHDLEVYQQRQEAARARRARVAQAVAGSMSQPPQAEIERARGVGACGLGLCEVPPVSTSTGCVGLVLIADDGTFLGDAVGNRYAANGVCNEYSTYGSRYGADSIYNEYGVYGSEFSAQSAYSRYTSTPPALFCANSKALVAFVTKNEFVAGAPLVDPDALCVVLANNGF